MIVIELDWKFDFYVGHVGHIDSLFLYNIYFLFFKRTKLNQVKCKEYKNDQF